MEDIVRALLIWIGENPERPGLVDTPRRVERAWDAWTWGYEVDVATLLTTFKDGAEDVDEMITVQDIPFYSHCEHHLAPFFGTATVSYIPNGRIVGLSKVNRLVEVFARRLQVQERLTTQVADAIMTHLKPLGCAVSVSARHLCMESRGIKQQGHSTRTSALRGVFKNDPNTRREFLAMVHGK